jgi:hypothetical protein
LNVVYKYIYIYVCVYVCVFMHMYILYTKYRRVYPIDIKAEDV